MRCFKSSVVATLAMSTLTTTAFAGGGVTSRWTNNSGDGSWTTDENWQNTPDQGGYPDNGNQGFNYTAIVRQGTTSLGQNISLINLFLGIDPSNQSFGNGQVISSSMITLDDRLEVGGSSTLSGSGTLATPLVTLPASGLTIDGWTINAPMILLGDADSNSQVTLQSNALLNVSGVLNIQRDGDIVSQSDDAPHVMINGGTTRKTGSQNDFGTSDIRAPYTSNGGILQSTSGVLRFPGPVGGAQWPVQLSGTALDVSGTGQIVFNRSATLSNNAFTFADNRWVELFDGTFALSGMMTGSGAGDLRVTGTALLIGPATMSFAGNSTWRLDGGMLAAGGFTNTAGFDWSAGTIATEFVTQAPADAPAKTMDSIGSRVVDMELGGLITNQGYFQQEHSITLNAPMGDPFPGIVNESGAVWELRGGGLFGAFGQFVNAGQFISENNAAGGVTVVSPFRSINGQVVIKGGGTTFQFAELLSDTTVVFMAEPDEGPALTVLDGRIGNVTVSSTSGQSLFDVGSIDFAGGTLQASADIGSTGFFRFDSGTITGIETLNCGSGFPFEQSAPANLNADITNEGDYRWKGGTISGLLSNHENLTILPPGPCVLKDKASLTNPEGSVEQKQPVDVKSESQILNQSGWRITATAPGLMLSSSDGTGSFANIGDNASFVAEANATVELSFNNLGTVIADAAVLTFQPGTVEQYDQVTGTLTGGRWLAQDGGRISVLAIGEPVHIVSSGAIVVLDGDQSSFDGLDQLQDVQGGFSSSSGGIINLLPNGNGGQLNVDETGEIGGIDAILLTGGEPTTIICEVIDSVGLVTVVGSAILQANTAVNLNAGVLRGTGTVATPIVDNIGGTVRPGEFHAVELSDDDEPGIAPESIGLPGILTIDGDYTQQTDGALRIDLVGTAPGFDHDQLHITGSATLGGTLIVNVDENDEPQVGQTFTILTANSVSGAFDQIISDAAFDVTYNADSVLVTVIAQPTCTGDLNNDSAVDIGDLLQLLSAWGACDLCNEDLNNDGVVGIVDLLELLSAWGPCS